MIRAITALAIGLALLAPCRAGEVLFGDTALRWDKNAVPLAIKKCCGDTIELSVPETSDRQMLYFAQQDRANYERVVAFHTHGMVWLIWDMAGTGAPAGFEVDVIEDRRVLCVTRGPAAARHSRGHFIWSMPATDRWTVVANCKEHTS